ncbi:S41 family peptidase [Chitinophaga dinghuensis]|nr:S41 family peptidase [Chitinophaga dinghuensis]
MYRKVILFTIGTLLCCSIHAVGQGLPYKQDLDTLLHALQDNYPSLYRFHTPAEIKRMYHTYAQQINATTSRRDCYKLTKYFLSSLQDGHLGCTPPDTLKKLFDEEEKIFPVAMVFLAGKAYVDCDPSGKLPVGTEILSINEKPVAGIVEKLFQYIVSDGEINSKKYRILDRNFSFYYQLVYGPHAGYHITYRDIRGAVAMVDIYGETRSHLSCTNHLQPADTPLLVFSYPQPHTALLTIRTFAQDDLEAAGLDFAHFLDSAFHQLQQQDIKALIIDVRGNGGGRDVYGALLYAYLTDRPFRYYAQLSTTSRLLTAADHPNLAMQQPQAANFKGKVFLLTDGLSFSVTSEFCAVVRSHRRALFIGTETGGGYCGNTSGSFKEVLLPYSHISVAFPTVRYTMAVQDNGKMKRGIIPDYEVTPTIGQLISHRDMALELALEKCQF